ncbi:MAG: 3-keto-5-aminohexanoate cleavage protein [Pseudomonadota bacterium]
MQAKRKVWLEAAINGAAGRRRQPRVPVMPEEIIQDALACARAGASIIHFHAYDPETQEPKEDVEIYARVIEAVRSQTDAIVYPTLAFRGEFEERIAPIDALGRRGLMEWGVLDPGSVNITHNFHIEEGDNGLLYANSDGLIRALLDLAARDKWRPSYAIYEPGFARAGAILGKGVEGLPTPVYRVMFSRNFTFGLPPEPYALDLYGRLIADVAPDAPWMIAGLDVDLQRISPVALAMGAHIRVGLEDAPFGCERSNVALVERAAAMIEGAGFTLATPDDVRHGLSVYDKAA